MDRGGKIMDYDYKEAIIKMIQEISTPKFLERIYCIVSAVYRKEITDREVAGNEGTVNKAY